MDLSMYLTLSIKVLTDWRVLAATVAIFIIWTLFRFVGIISQRPPRRYQPPSRPMPRPTRPVPSGKNSED